jgi:hypothetical protein
MSGERLEAIVKTDEGSRTAIVAVADAFRSVHPQSVTGAVSDELFSAIRTIAHSLLLQNQPPEPVEIVPDSLVARLAVTIDGRQFHFVFPVNEDEMPLEKSATEGSYPFSQFVPLTTSEPLKEFYRAMTNAANQVDCSCRENTPQESVSHEQDLTYLSPDQLALYRDIQSDQTQMPQESATEVASPPEPQTHRVSLGTHKLPNEIRGCWRHGVDTRSARIKVYVDLSHPSLFDFVNKAIDCALGCAGGALILAVATGVGAAASIAAFKACFYACLATQVGHAVAREVHINFGSDKETGDWSGH